MKQAAADAGVGHIPGLEKIAELVKRDEIIGMVHDPVGQVLGHILVLDQSIAGLSQQFVLKKK